MLFSKDTKAAIETKLAKTKAEIEAAEVNLSTLALEAAISEDYNAANKAAMTVTDLWHKHVMLERALIAASQAEQEQKDKAHQAANLSKQRALAQHGQRFTASARKIAGLLESLIAEHQRLVATGATINATIGQKEPWTTLLSPKALMGMVNIECYRQGQQSDVLLFSRPTGSGTAPINADWTFQTLVSRVSGMMDTIKGLGNSTGGAVAAVTAAPVEDAQPVPQSSIEPLYPPAASEPILIDLRSKHPTAEEIAA